jgi:hypothetical protein
VGHACSLGHVSASGSGAQWVPGFMVFLHLFFQKSVSCNPLILKSFFMKNPDQLIPQRPVYFAGFAV